MRFQDSIFYRPLQTSDALESINLIPGAIDRQQGNIGCMNTIEDADFNMAPITTAAG